jgi:hypothetical protein
LLGAPDTVGAQFAIVTLGYVVLLHACRITGLLALALLRRLDQRKRSVMPRGR